MDICQPTKAKIAFNGEGREKACILGTVNLVCTLFKLVSLLLAKKSDWAFHPWVSLLGISKKIIPTAFEFSGGSLRGWLLWQAISLLSAFLFFNTLTSVNSGLSIALIKICQHPRTSCAGFVLCLDLSHQPVSHLLPPLVGGGEEREIISTLKVKTEKCSIMEAPSTPLPQWCYPLRDSHHL